MKLNTESLDTPSSFFADEDVLAAEFYKDLFMAEKENNNSFCRKLETVILKSQTADGIGCSPPAVTEIGQFQIESQWDEWQQFRAEVDGFDTRKNQYILIADSVPQEFLPDYSLLKRVSWEMVLDFDPLSEKEGLYNDFTSKEGQSRLVSMFTPLELNPSSCSIMTLMRKIDTNKTQWLFVNGRSDDIEEGCKEYSGLNATSLKGIQNFLTCCSDSERCDLLKPVKVLLLPFEEKNLTSLQDILTRLTEHLNHMDMTFVAINNNNWLRTISDKFDFEEFNISPQILRFGLTELLDASNEPKLRMPSSHAGAPAILSPKEYLYIKEHLEVLYLGCEDLPRDKGNSYNTKKQREVFLAQQRKSFLSGNTITFASLFDKHDARREVENDIQIYVQRLLDQRLPKSVIVEIRHSPGTGGSTIARRVLWDLHEDYPCAIINISDHPYFDEDNTFVNDIAERIELLVDICNTPPLILIDGKQSGAIESLSNKLSRVLQGKGKRVVILRCQRGSKPEAMEMSSQIRTFHVNVRLEESDADLCQFKLKYEKEIASIGKPSSKIARSGLCRVFHFPLLAMMEEFQPKLEKIIEDTFDELGGTQQEIALVVAFLQWYGNFPTPALLLYEAFKKHIHVTETKHATYEDIKEFFSDSLINLMIPTKQGPSTGDNSPESYTFQHPLVASLVLKRVYEHQKRDLFDVLDAFLEFPIYQQQTLRPLLFELFISNKKGAVDHEELKFSILFEELKENDCDRAAEVFCKAAEKLNDPLVYGNAARFYARKNPPSFPEAKELIRRARQLYGSSAKGEKRYKTLCHTEGFILQVELTHMIKHGEIEDLEILENVARNAVKAHREARDFPPTHPHPLIGEVDVFLQCIKWIMNNKCQGDTEKTLEFLTNMAPPFFRTCISDSFYLLDVVDRIVQSVAHQSDYEKTKRLSNERRLSLMKTCRRQYSRKRKANEDIVQICKAICTSDNFHETSLLEIKRLQAHFILSHYESAESGGGLKGASLQYLLDLLEELVFRQNEYQFAKHLMKVCILVTGGRYYTLEKGLSVCKIWSKGSSHDCLPYFYEMVISFLGILDGDALELTPKYIQAREKCEEKSQNDVRKFNHLIYLRKGGEGMSRLISRQTLLLGETDYSPSDDEKVSRFWQVGSRKNLLECEGRIRVKQSFGSLKSHRYYIELKQGNLRLYVGKHADIGKAEVNFTPGDLVYFVVSFTLRGPVANGITFSPLKKKSKR